MGWKVGGRIFCQPGQDREVAAVTEFFGSFGLPLSSFHLDIVNLRSRRAHVLFIRSARLASIASSS